MSDDKDQRTFKPTPKRISDFRKRGEIALSRDLTTVATLLGGVLGCAFFSGSALSTFTSMTRRSLLALSSGDMESSVRLGVNYAGSAIIQASIPAIIGAFIGFVISSGVQLGWPPVFKGIGFDPFRMFQPQSIAQMISPKAIAGRAAKSVGKIVFVAGACTLALLKERDEFMSHPALEPGELGMRIGSAVVRTTLFGIFALGLMAAVDYILQKRSLMARMRMTADEVKREHREQEGDPQIKRRRRQRARELAKRRIQLAVKSADVVLVNPTEYAVALRYRSAEDQAPRVVAKGRGMVAERIREIARQNGVPIIAEPPLCRLIHRLCREGQEIPAQVYHAVAEVLAYVYRLRKRAA